MKGNDGKALERTVTQQLAFLIVATAIIVTGIKFTGSSSWHAKPQRHEEFQRDIADNTSQEIDQAVLLNAGDKSLIKIVFSNLDGEEGRDGEVLIKLHEDWAPLGVKRIQELTEAEFWDECRAFRVLPNFVVQLGINGSPIVQKKWRSLPLKDDPVIPNYSNIRGTVTFAMSGPNTRTTQIFFNTVDNSRLDKEKFAPFGRVTSGMDIIDRIYSGYKETVEQGKIQR